MWALNLQARPSTLTPVSDASARGPSPPFPTLHDSVLGDEDTILSTQHLLSHDTAMMARIFAFPFVNPLILRISRAEFRIRKYSHNHSVAISRSKMAFFRTVCICIAPMRKSCGLKSSHLFHYTMR